LERRRDAPAHLVDGVLLPDTLPISGTACRFEFG
jgi:hypothetical protein